MIPALARFFQGIHIAFGMTGLRENATPREEKNFVVMWFVIILVIILWAALLAYWLGR